MTKNLAVRERNGGSTTAIATLEQSDMIIPRLRLVQAQSTFSEREGWLFNSLTSEAAESVRVVVLKVGKNRIMWPKQFVRGQQPLCASDDAIAPRPQFAGTYSERCDVCPKAEWLNDRPPECAFGYTYLLACRDAGDLPVILSASRTSLRAAKQVNTLISAFGVRFEIIVSSERVVNDYGKFHTLSFRLGDPVNPDDMAKYAAMSAAFGGTQLGPDAGLDDDDDDDDGGSEGPPPWEGFEEDGFEEGQFTEKPPAKKAISSKRVAPAKTKKAWHNRTDLIGRLRKIDYYKHPAQILATLKALENEGTVNGELSDDQLFAILEGHASQQTAKAAPPASGHSVRPAAPEAVKERLTQKAGQFSHYRPPSKKQLGLMNGMLSKIFGGDQERRTWLGWVFNVSSSSEMTGGQVSAVLDWLGLEKNEMGEYIPSPPSIIEAKSMLPQALREKGQQDMVLPLAA